MLADKGEINANTKMSLVVSHTNTLIKKIMKDRQTHRDEQIKRRT